MKNKRLIKYPRKLSFHMSKEMRKCLAEEKKMTKQSLASIVRSALNERYGIVD